MGLDIYLYRYDNYEDTEGRENLHDEFSTKLWNEAGEYESLSQEQKDEIRAKSEKNAEELGLDKWGSDEKNKESIEINSEKYPDHYFKVGYFRSSYNESGIERILKNLNLPLLRDVFEVEERYKFRPDWEKSLSNINDLIEKFTAAGAYRVSVVADNIFKKSEISSETEALKAFLEEASKNTEYNYSNSVGEFFMHEPQKVLAFIPGKREFIGRDQDCIYVIKSSDNTWYLQALEIVRETILYVLGKENRDQYYLHWSG